MHRRDKYAIYYEILQALELPKTKMQLTIALEMSLPWAVMGVYMDRLRKAGLVVLVEQGKEKKYYITPKGKRYLEIYPALDLSKYFR